MLTASFWIFSQSCDSSKKVLKNVDPDKITETFNIKTGDKFNIKVPSNPTTGYKWELTCKINKCIELVKSEYNKEEQSNNMIGSGGEETWTFLSKVAGKTYILLRYKKGNDFDEKKDKYYEVIVE